MYPNLRTQSSYSEIPCLKCKSRDLKIISPLGIYTCSECLKPVKLVLCKECNFRSDLCEYCHSKNPEYKTKKTSPKSGDTELQHYDFYFWIFIICCILILICAVWTALSPLKENFSLYNNLVRKYPSQKNETWTNILSALDTETPTVKSLTLLHGDDTNTVNCLTKDLVAIYTKDNKINEKEVTFGKVSQEVKDYGEVLEFYRPIVKKRRILVADLNKVPANFARVFHTLCDEVSSDIKPSIFIFTLHCDNSTSHLKGIERASKILRKNWLALSENELYPLLSRVIKTVVEIIPEKKKCS